MNSENVSDDYARYCRFLKNLRENPPSVYPLFPEFSTPEEFAHVVHRLQVTFPDLYRQFCNHLRGEWKDVREELGKRLQEFTVSHPGLEFRGDSKEEVEQSLREMDQYFSELTDLLNHCYPYAKGLYLLAQKRKHRSQ